MNKTHEILTDSDNMKNVKQAFMSAAKKGNIEALSWLWDKNPQYALTQDEVECAIESGEPVILQWIYDNIEAEELEIDTHQMYLACEFGNVRVAKWLKSKNLVMEMPETGFYHICQVGSVEFVSWMADEMEDLETVAEGFEYAMGYRNLEVAKWIEEYLEKEGYVFADESDASSDTDVSFVCEDVEEMYLEVTQEVKAMLEDKDVQALGNYVLNEYNN